jgi:ferric-dicitrate binding protein FerR (iron transport regulator)
MAAASIILLIGAVSAWIYRERLLDTFDPVPVRQLAASSFSVREVLLPDSSVVILNGGSSIRFPERFRGSKRAVVITGQAFFKVRSRPQQPFEVSADSLHVRVIGTSFVVSNDYAAILATVGVTSGKVAVRYDREDFPETMLTPGRELQYDKLNTKIRVIGNSSIPTDWTTKRLIFAATPLPDVFHAIEQSYGTTIRYQVSSMHNKAFTGSFDRNDLLPEVLKVLSLSYGLTIQQNKDGSLTIR